MTNSNSHDRDLYEGTMPFCCIQHSSDVQAIFPAFAANSIVPVATIYSHLSDVQAIFPAFAANLIVHVATIYGHLSDVQAIFPAFAANSIY